MDIIHGSNTGQLLLLELACIFQVSLRKKVSKQTNQYFNNTNQAVLAEVGNFTFCVDSMNSGDEINMQQHCFKNEYQRGGDGENEKRRGEYLQSSNEITLFSSEMLLA